MKDKTLSDTMPNMKHKLVSGWLNTIDSGSKPK